MSFFVRRPKQSLQVCKQECSGWILPLASSAADFIEAEDAEGTEPFFCAGREQSGSFLRKSQQIFFILLILEAKCVLSSIRCTGSLEIT